MSTVAITVAHNPVAGLSHPRVPQKAFSKVYDSYKLAPAAFR